jgi:hypothetical protein
LVLDYQIITFLKSAIWAAYWEGVRLRLGGSGSKLKEEYPGRCSSFMIIFISKIECKSWGL